MGMEQKKEKIFTLPTYIGFVFSFWVSIFPLSVFAQDNYSAKHWGNEEKLSQENITGIIKDQKSFLWVSAVAGLYRFDGYNFKTFPNGRSNKSPIDVFGRGLVEDSLHNIWIGCASGLSRYDLRADTFSNFLSKPVSDSDNTMISPFWATKDEVFCFEKLNSITAYDIHTYKKRILINQVQTKYPGADKAVQSIYSVKTNSLYLLNYNGILKISLDNGVQENILLPNSQGRRPEEMEAPGMCYDAKRNLIWVSCQSGLFQFSLNENHIIKIDLLNNWIHGVYPGIAMDKKGQVWISSFSKGIIIYNPDSQTSTPLFRDSTLQSGTAENTGIIYPDHEGITWLGKFSNSGLVQLIPKPPVAIRINAGRNRPFALSSKEIYAITEGPENQLWIATSEGINILDTKTGEVQVLGKRELSELPDQVILGILADSSKRKAWVVVKDGVFEMDMRSWHCKPVIFLDYEGKDMRLSQFYGTILEPYHQGCLIKKMFPNRLFVIYADSAIARQILSFPQSSLITKLHFTDNHWILLKRFGVSNDLTYVEKNNNWKPFPTPLDSLGWNDINYKSSDQTYWVGFDWKINHYSRDFKLIESYSYKEGETGFQLFRLLTDTSRYIWFNTSRNIACLDSKTGQIMALSDKDGYSPQKYEWNQRPVINRAGKLFFFGDKGLDIINPGNISGDYPASTVYFKNLEVNRRQPDLLLGIDEVSILRLPYDRNRINVETGVIDFYSMGSSRIRYKLEGLNTEWEYAPADHNIRYEKLPPGQYTLVVQASNAAQEWNGPEKKLIILIEAPYWQTWWFLSLAVLGLIALLYFIYRWRTASLRRQKVKLEQVVVKRTAEVINQKEEISVQRDHLEKTLQELKSTQSQLIHAEKMASLGELTAGIAHEIQNPLNFVNNFSEVSSELMEEMKEELVKGNTDEVNSIANEVKQNLTKIHTHGRRADAIVKGMLQHSRASSGQKELTDINTLADEYLRLAYYGWQSKDKSFHVTLQTDYEEGLKKISIISQDIGRVFLNLFNNAFYAVIEKKKISEDGYEPIIKISTELIKSNQYEISQQSPAYRQAGELRNPELIRISITDNGPGISEKVKDKIFQPFFTTKPTGQGTGLGLSLSYDIIKVHGGEIKMETLYGGSEGSEVEGTIFIIQLPV